MTHQKSSVASLPRNREQLCNDGCFFNTINLSLPGYCCHFFSYSDCFFRALLLFLSISEAFSSDSPLLLDVDDAASRVLHHHCLEQTHTRGHGCLSTCFANSLQSQETNSSTLWFIKFTSIKAFHIWSAKP